MPRKSPSDLTSIGGKSTELGRDNFLRKARARRKLLLAEQTNYREITELVFESEFRGSLSKWAANSSGQKRKGKDMPKATTKLNNVVDIAGKRGRKSEFNSADWVMDIGLDNAFDVTEEMHSGIAKLDDPFDPELLFSNDNSDVNKYRNNRFGAMKRAAISANGEKTKYELKVAENDKNERLWILVRTA